MQERLVELSPAVQASIRKGVAAIEISQGITEILEDGGFDLTTINSIILRYVTRIPVSTLSLHMSSHSHLDHIGVQVLINTFLQPA
jgi:hypothetical protein